MLFFGHINFESVMWCKSVRGAAMAPGRFDAAFTSTQLQPNLRLYNLYQFEPTLLPSRVGRSTAEPYANTGNISQPRYGKIARYPLAELDNGARSFGGYTEGCCVGWAWHRFAAACNRC